MQVGLLSPMTGRYRKMACSGLSTRSQNHALLFSAVLAKRRMAEMNDKQSSPPPQWLATWQCAEVPACWPRPIPVSERLPELDTDYLAYGYMSPGSHRKPTDTRCWVEATYHSPTGPGDTAHWASKYLVYLFDVTHYLPLPRNPE